MKDLKDFRIGKADYFIENKSGSKIKINVNYRDNKFRTSVLVFGKNVQKLKHEASAIAKNMLGKKAQKNLVKKLLELKI